MKKVSLLAASVAFALVGCGGGSDNNTDGNTGTNPPAPGGVVITGFDGYFQNAVMFVDQNDNGKWDTSDTFLGLTNAKGQLELTEKPKGTLALQTITPNGTAQAKLIALNANYAGRYTVDMDHPSQAMAHEVVFRAPNNSDVISPITDLVAIEMASGKTAEEAQAAVNIALGGTDAAPVDLFSDFVKGDKANAELHKTAQILTESKAANPESYEKKATEFAKEADTLVENMTDEAIKDVNNKPVIEDTTPDSDNLAPEVITNSKLIVDATVKEAAVKALPTLKEDDNFSGVEIAIADLFVDADQEAGVVPTIKSNLEGTGITASIEAGKLVLTPANPVTKPGNYTLTLTASDVDSKGNALETTASTEFNITIEALNKAPEFNKAEQAELQNTINTWDLEEGTEVQNLSINVSNLFTDNENDILTLTASTSVAGLTASVDNNGELALSGKPSEASTEKQRLSVTATDRDGSNTSVTVDFVLPEVKEGVVVPPPANELGFTNAHFKDGVWKMGSFNSGDNEVGFATLRNTGGLLEFCWSSDDSLTNHGHDKWDYALAELDKLTSTKEFIADDCGAVTIAEDGSLVDASGDNMPNFQMLYQHTVEEHGNTEYQIIFKMDDELFWLDSTETPFDNTLAAGITPETPVYKLTDDANGVNIDPMVEVNIYHVDTTYTSTDLNGTNASKGDFWDVETDEETNFERLYMREPWDGGYDRYNYINRHFGQLSIGITDKVTSNELENNVSYYITSEDKALISDLYSRWVPAE
ncbi:acid phosphatase [Photobacterium japonica]|uniref:acid phosphatase n=1 Tax=Photobacterium japonica TaxID=2910235 RepID=UPI003D0C0B00